MIKEIGGFFQLELRNGEEFHGNSIKLNTGRNCLYYILKAKKYKKIYLPYYICNSVLQPINQLGLNYEFYYINEKFELDFFKNVKHNEVLLYVNYFGINTTNVKGTISNFQNIIIDNTQAFFEKQVMNEDTFYSPRKFFGVSDGGYLYTDRNLEETISQDLSFMRCEHLLKRVDEGASKSYTLFKKNEEYFDKCDIRRMSTLTEKILKGIDYSNVIKIRNENFLYLHESLYKYNEINVNIEDLKGPMIYPFLINVDGLREYLISKNIYIAIYWIEVLDRVAKDKFEYHLVKHLIPIPIDQRYNLADMKFILESIKYFINWRKK